MLPSSTGARNGIGLLPLPESHETIPSSSIAVIVQNFSKANGNSQLTAAGRDDFQQLLAELLGPNDVDGGDAMVLEEDVAMNYRLIRIVTSAGVMVLLQDDPFAVQEDLVTQAFNSLLVIRKSIRRNPQVLFCPPPISNDLKESDQCVLYLWLLPRLLPLLGHTNAEKLMTSLLETIDCIFVSATQIPEAWRYAKDLISYFRACFTFTITDSGCVLIRAIISAFQSTARMTAAMSKSFHIELPGEDFVVHNTFVKEQLACHPRSVRFHIRCPAQAGLVAIHIYSILAGLVKSSQHPGLRTASDNSMWMLTGVATLWGSLSAWEGLHMLTDKLRTLKRHVIGAFCRALDDTTLSSINPMRMGNMAILGLRCTAETLGQGIQKIDQDLELPLASMLLTLLKIAQSIPSVSQLLLQQVYPQVVAFIEQEREWALLQKDFQIAIIAIIITLSTDEMKTKKVADLLHSVSDGKWVFKDINLQRKAGSLGLCELSEDNVMGGTDAERPRKRARLTPECLKQEFETEVDVSTMISEVSQLLGNQPAPDLAGLSRVASGGFKNIKESERFVPVRNLGLIACALAGTLRQKLPSAINNNDWGGYHCSVCDSDELKHSGRKNITDTTKIHELCSTLISIVKLGEYFRATPQTRIWGMMSLRRLINHTDDPDLLNAETNELGQWCVGSLDTSIRELRLAATRTLSSYVNFSHNAQLLRMNLHYIVTALRTLSETEDSLIQESCVMAWGQMGCVLPDQELEVVLTALVQFLGHSNSFIVGVAYNEIQRLATAHKETPRRLFTPFLPSLSYNVVRQLQSRPQIIQLLSELCLVEVPEFLVITQTHTLPYLILHRKADIIERIAYANGQTTVKALCVTHSNMTAILAVLLTQDVGNVEETAIMLLHAVSLEFRKVTLDELVRSAPIPLAEELIKMAGDRNDTQQEAKDRIFNALRLVATLQNKKPTGASKKEKKADPLGTFFDTNVLGIMAQFSDTIHDVKGRSTPMEKVRCLRGIAEMTKLVKGRSSSALPQICACLQSAMKFDVLRKHAFRAWATVMCELPEEDVVPLMGQTFAIVLQYWEHLPDDAQEQVREMVIELFDLYPKQLEKNVHSLPSLSPIELMSKQESKLKAWKEMRDPRHRFLDFATRCRNENGAVVEQALFELSVFLQQEQSFIHTTAMGEQPDVVVSELMRSLLDACVQFKDTDCNISRLSAECLGIIGAVDPSKVDAPRALKQIIVLQNFELAEESLDFVTFLLEHRLVKAFLAATDTKAQGFLAYAMQELLKFCEFDANVVISRRSPQGPTTRRWREFSEISRSILTPYLTSKYVLTGNSPGTRASQYPIYRPEHTYRSWLQEFLFDLMTKVQGDNASAIFAICSRIIKGQDIAIPHFILPYVTLNVVISGTDMDRKKILQELLAIVERSETPGNPLELETLRECSEAVFLLVDYLSKWLKAKKQHNSSVRAQAARVQNRHLRVDEDEVHDIAVSRVETILAGIPPEIMGIRSFECKSYPRALFYWEQHIRNSRELKSEEDMKSLYETLQHIYAQIDEPDGIEGISAHLKIYTIDQQIVEHRNAGRWTAAQSWYEMQLCTKPNDIELQANLLSCLRESGQYDNLLTQADYLMKKTNVPSPMIVDIAVQASWLSEKWEYLETFLKANLESTESSYEIHLGRALTGLRLQDSETFKNAIQAARQEVIKGLTHSSTGTLDQCHPSILKLHALYEVESISSAINEGQFQHSKKRELFMARLQQRLDLVGASAHDREHILAIRRVVFGISNNYVVKQELAATWLATARLARKAGRFQQAFHAILQSSKLGEQSAPVEHARLLWHEGQHRKAIQSLQGIIDAKVLNASSASSTAVTESEITGNENMKIPQNSALAKANLLLAKWLDTAGHLHSSDMTAQYQKASNTFLKWEQGFYYLGRHYNKLYEAQKSLPPSQQPTVYLYGETAKLVCQNYLRSLPWGTKYIFQTLPRFLTLWLDLGLPMDWVTEHGTVEFRAIADKEREKSLAILHATLQKRYIEMIPAYMWYTVFPQILSRICHHNATVHRNLENIITKVASTHPQQALWSLMAVLKSTQKERSARGLKIICQIQAIAKANRAAEKKQSSDTRSTERADMRVMITQAQKLTEQLLALCNAELPGKPAAVSLKNDLRFNHAVAPCPLVIPIQAVLSATLPTVADLSVISTHQSFAHEQPTIQSFLDDADVMSSLQKPRKITIVGNNGKRYNFLCKPKDDLRKDARLMEFASMINRLLKKDSEAIQRRLHIRTYHVTPLNEECGLIEWVNNVRPLRDILFKQYKKRGITVNFQESRALLDEACSSPSKLHVFTKTLLQKYPPVLHEWFVDHFPDPATWLSSRTGYARTSAVWSMVGNVLGLGDRHGENILLDETNGDTAHVDFNCLFDKGLTFEKPEMVPFRLTHNMVDGFGVSGYEGPFRRSCEIVTRILRLNEATLMTVLEAFLYDPAVDMSVNKKSKKGAGAAKVSDNPKDVLDGIRTKIQGLFPGEGMPLSVEGQVQELIRKAVSPDNLCKMYIGWMSFF